jgi:secreted trypsin-like serine protease
VRTGIFGGGRVQCGGVLINDKYVITTSNCMDGTYTDGIQVWLTAHNTFQSDNYLEQDRVLKRDVVEIFMHPNYNRQTHDNDVALLKLSKPVDISVSSYYVPICLPATETNYDGMTAKLASWGASTINSGRIFGSRICNEDVPVISNDVCNRDTRHSGKVTSNMMCAGLLTPSSRESCLGDSGGPLMLPNGGRYSLIGVVSWGFQNRQSYSPIVYSKVSGYSDWILHNTRDADWCGI